MTMREISFALASLRPNEEYSLIGDDYDNINWISDTTPPTKAEVQAEVDRLKPIQAYQDSREKEYPDIKEQLDYIYHNGLTKWKSDMIKPVKDKYPK
tara:strand:- start:5 stop:295 length:291 start_codon:yes stop_codon:yes gene_type:complete